jgi:hypothetical protein
MYVQYIREEFNYYSFIYLVLYVCTYVYYMILCLL